MAVQVNGNYPVIDLSETRVELYNKYELSKQENKRLYDENEYLKLQHLHDKTKIFQLQDKCDENEYLKLQHLHDKTKISQLQQHKCDEIEYLKLQLQRANSKISQLEHKVESVEWPKSQFQQQWFSKCTVQQEKTVMKKQEESKKKYLLNKVDNVSISSKHVKMKVTKVVDSKDAEILENKLLVYDRNAVDESREQTCNVRGRTAMRDKPDSIILGRFEVDSKLTECMQCHQVFNSLAEMEASICFFHPTNCSPTGSPGKYFWKCCKVEAAKSCGGCQIGRHIQATHY